MIYDFFDSNHWFKDLDLFSSWCTLGDMAPKLNFAMKSPPKAKCKAKADAKARAKVKAEPPKSPDQKAPEITDVEVSRHDQQLFNTFFSRSDDPRAESLKAIYNGMARNDPKKKELVAQWKLDKTLSWHVHYEEIHTSGKSQEQTQTVGWMTRWKFLFCMYILIFCFFLEIKEGGRTHHVD